MFYPRRVATDEPRCARCLDLEDELADLRQQLAAVGRYVAFSPGPNTNPELERELRRWLAVYPRADGAAGFRAGWARLSRWVRPRLHDWGQRWWRLVRENTRLRAQIGMLLPVSWNTPAWRASRALRLGPLDSSRSVTNSGGEATG